MRRRAAVLFGLALVSATEGAAAPAAPLADWAGVYKQRFKGELVTGESYQAENILEIVDTGPDRIYGTGPTRAYVRVHLDFFNAHICDLWGIAVLKGDALVYTSKERYQGAPPCSLTLSRQGTKIALADKGTCQPWRCGASGGFDEISFDRSARKPIRYLPLLKGSKEYKQALAELR